MEAKVGVEPTGIPRNPMINAGAIATAAPVWQHDPDQAEALTLAFFCELAGRRLEVDEAVYRYERETGQRNRAISHLLRNAAVIEHQPDAVFGDAGFLSGRPRQAEVMAETNG